MVRQSNGAYIHVFSGFISGRYESKVLQAGLGIDSYTRSTIQLLLFFTLPEIGRWYRKEPYITWQEVGKIFTCPIASSIRQSSKFYSIDVLIQSLRFVPQCNNSTYKIASTHDITRSMQLLY